MVATVIWHLAFQGKLMLLLIAIVGTIWKRCQRKRLLTVNCLFHAARNVANFSNMQGAFPTVPADRDTCPVSAFLVNRQAVLLPSFNDWITDRSAKALIILKDGAIVREAYEIGTSLSDRLNCCSVAKGYLS